MAGERRFGWCGDERGGVCGTAAAANGDVAIRPRPISPKCDRHAARCQNRPVPPAVSRAAAWRLASRRITARRPSVK